MADPAVTVQYMKEDHIPLHSASSICTFINDTIITNELLLFLQCICSIARHQRSCLFSPFSRGSFDGRSELLKLSRRTEKMKKSGIIRNHTTMFKKDQTVRIVSVSVCQLLVWCASLCCSVGLPPKAGDYLLTSG